MNWHCSVLVNVVPLSATLDSFSMGEILCQWLHPPTAAVIYSTICYIEPLALPMVCFECYPAKIRKNKIVNKMYFKEICYLFCKLSCQISLVCWNWSKINRISNGDHCFFCSKNSQRKSMNSAWLLFLKMGSLKTNNTENPWIENVFF